MPSVSEPSIGKRDTRFNPPTPIVNTLLRQMARMFDAIRSGWQSMADSGRGRNLRKAAKTIFVLGIVAYLAWQLRDVDLVQVAGGLPLNPAFYALLLVVYFALPASQILAYRITWTFRLREAVPVFIKKRILNRDVLGYSGEVFLFSWATKHLKETPKALMKTIRDQNILSSAASTMVAIVLIIVFISTGQITLADLVGEQQRGTIIAVTTAAGVLLAILVRIWKYVFSMHWRPATLVFGVHVARLLVRQVAEIAMWHLAMPEVPLKVWFTIAAVMILVSRIPFLVAVDLLNISIAVGLSGVLGVSEPHILALFAAIALVQRGINLLFFAALPVFERKSESTTSEL